MLNYIDVYIAFCVYRLTRPDLNASKENATLHPCNVTGPRGGEWAKTMQDETC